MTKNFAALENILPFFGCIHAFHFPTDVGGGRQRPVLRLNKPKKTGERSAAKTY
jgi:hypothetical protein